jgi:hypothetical protein
MPDVYRPLMVPLPGGPVGLSRKGSAHGPYVPGLCRGRYHTDRHLGAALQNTALCPAGLPARPHATFPPLTRGRGQWGSGQALAS